MIIRGLLVCLLALSLFARADNCVLPTSSFTPLNDDDFLISVMRLNGRPVFDGLDVYKVNDRLLIPASLVSDALSLGWEINIPGSVISFEGSEAFCAFSLNFETTNTENTPSGLVWSADDFDIYIDIEFLPILLPVEYEFNFSLLHLNITSSELGYNDYADDTTIIPTFFKRETLSAERVIDDNYQLYTSPLLSYRLSAQKGSENQERLATNVNAGFDLLNHAANFRVSRTGDNSLHFLRFSRTFDDMASAVSNRGLTYEFGDIQLLGDNLVTSPNQSLGFVFHNGDTRGQRNFSKTTIEEFVLPGWRVQLFRNGQFIDEKFSDEQNKVLFEDVDTFYGANLFELKLYGPEGQQENRTQSVNVGEDQVQKGDIDFFVGASDRHYRLLDGEVSQTGLGKSAIAKLGIGLSNSTSVSGTVQRLWVDDSPESYFTASLDTQLAGSALNFSLTKQSSEGFASFVGWNGRIDDNVVFTLSNRYFNNFTSERYSDTVGLESETVARFNGQSERWGRFGWNGSVSFRSFSEREDQASLSLNLNNNLLGGTFSGGITVTDNTKQSVNGRLYYSKQLAEWQVASAWDFTPSEQFDTESFYVSLRWPYLLSQHRETRLQYRANGAQNIELQHQHNWGFDSINVGLGASIAEGGSWSVNLSFTGNINYNPYTRSLNLDRAAGAAAGRIDAFTFFDANRNNQFDDEESALEGVMFKGNSIWRDEKTNVDGRARLITNHQIQSVAIEPSSLPDPYMVAAYQRVDINTHSGGVSHISMPVHAVNDVEGTIYLVSSDNSRGAPNLLVNILNKDNEVVAQTRTESDGYFYISQLAPGEYKMSVDQDYLERNALFIDSEQLSFVAPEEGDAIFLDDIKLVKTTTPAVDPEQWKDMAIVDATIKYEIQIGIFRHARSIYEVIKHLTVAPTSMQYYRNHDLAMTYVTVGGFTDLTDANAYLNAIKAHPAFNNAFVSPISRYHGEQWRKESVYFDIQEKIESSTEAPSKNYSSVLCQLSAYYSLSSINPRILTAHPELLLVPNAQQDATFYRLLAPLNENNECDDKYVDHEYRQGPLKVNTASVMHTPR